MINEYKSLFSRNDTTRTLIELGFCFLAFDFAMRKQIKKNFLKHNLETGSIIEYAETGGHYPESEIHEIKQKINSIYMSSLPDEERNARIKNLLIEQEIMELPLEPPGMSLSEELDKEYTKLLYQPWRKKEAIKLQRRLKLTDQEVCELQEIAFKNILVLLKKSEKNYSQTLGHVVELLETGIETYFPTFQKDLELKHKGRSLLSLRSKTAGKYNTLCRRCGKVLLKKGGKFYCTRKENRACYEARLTETKKGELPSVISRTKNRCENCGEHASLNHIHKHKNIERQFCSGRCWESYRKREQRKEK